MSSPTDDRSRATPQRYDGIAAWHEEYLGQMDAHYSLVRDALCALAGKGGGRCLDVASGDEPAPWLLGFEATRR